jgi:isochorismate pyruvate lyase
MKSTNQLVLIRRHIDEIDDQLVRLLVLRTKLALEASQFKHTIEEVRGEERVRQVLDSVMSKARSAGGYEAVVLAVYRVIISELTQLQIATKGFENS